MALQGKVFTITIVSYLEESGLCFPIQIIKKGGEKGFQPIQGGRFSLHNTQFREGN